MKFRFGLLVLVVLISGLFAFFTQMHLYLSDCSIGGVRDTAMIDDIDKTTGCLPPFLRMSALFLTPLIWASLIFIFLKKMKQFGSFNKKLK